MIEQRVFLAISPMLYFFLHFLSVLLLGDQISFMIQSLFDYALSLFQVFQRHIAEKMVNNIWSWTWSQTKFDFNEIKGIVPAFS